MIFKSAIIRAVRGGPFLLLVLPSSSNYAMQSYSFGAGGGTTTSTNYSQTGQAGQIASGKASSTNYLSGAGITFTEQADVPPAPAFTNSANSYNRLLVIINGGPNASDTTFAIAISSDGFTTTQYLRVDGTLGTNLSSSNYQTYALWGGTSGSFVLGLNPHTSYSAKVSAAHGAYTASAFGPSSGAATIDPALSFSLATSTQSAPPFSINFGSLPVNTVVSSPQNVLTSFTTNAQQGGNILLTGQNAGLRSAQGSYTIPSATVDLAGALDGFGVQSVSTSQISGGPLIAVSPFSSGGTSVGAVTSTPSILYSSLTPLVGGSTSFSLQAKAAPSDPAAGDYAEVITVTAAANF